MPCTVHTSIKFANLAKVLLTSTLAPRYIIATTIVKYFVYSVVCIEFESAKHLSRAKTSIMAGLND